MSTRVTALGSGNIHEDLSYVRDDDEASRVGNTSCKPGVYQCGNGIHGLKMREILCVHQQKFMFV